MSNDHKHVQTLTVSILDREYGVSAPADEVDDLKQSARMLDESMRQIRRSGKTVGIERIAVMAALNMAHELLKMRAELDHYERLTEKQLTRLNDKIEHALATAKKFEAS